MSRFEHVSGWVVASGKTNASTDRSGARSGHAVTAAELHSKRSGTLRYEETEMISE